MLRNSLFMASLAACALALGTADAMAQDRTGITDDAIKIGVMGPFTGNASSYSKAQLGLDAYYKQINDQGGIHGRKIVTILEDTACDQAKGIAAAKKLIHQDKVFMLHGNSCSGVALAVKPTAVEAGLPWVVAHAVNYKISSPPEKNIFHSVPTSYTLGEAIGKFVLSKPGTKNIAVIAHSNEWAKGYEVPALEYLKKHGVEPSLNLTFERGSTDATPHVLKLKQQNPDFVMAILYEAETVIFLRDAKKFGLNVPIMGTLGTDLENTLARLGDKEAMKNYFVQHPFVGPLDSPAMKKWGEMIHKYYPNESLTSFSFASIGGGVAVVEALKAAGRDLTREKFIAEMDKIRDLDTGILAGKVTFTPQDRWGVKDVAAAKFVNDVAVVYSAWEKPLQ